jgi:hypothetical protein
MPEIYAAIPISLPEGLGSGGGNSSSSSSSSRIRDNGYLKILLVLSGVILIVIITEVIIQISSSSSSSLPLPLSETNTNTYHLINNDGSHHHPSHSSVGDSPMFEPVAYSLRGHTDDKNKKNQHRLLILEELQHSIPVVTVQEHHHEQQYIPEKGLNIERSSISSISKSKPSPPFMSSSYSYVEVVTTSTQKQRGGEPMEDNGMGKGMDEFLRGATFESVSTSTTSSSGSSSSSAVGTIEFEQEGKEGKQLSLDEIIFEKEHESHEEITIGEEESTENNNNDNEEDKEKVWIKEKELDLPRIVVEDSADSSNEFDDLAGDYYYSDEINILLETKIM